MASEEMSFENADGRRRTDGRRRDPITKASLDVTSRSAKKNNKYKFIIYILYFNLSCLSVTNCVRYRFRVSHLSNLLFPNPLVD